MGGIVKGLFGGSSSKSKNQSTSQSSSQSGNMAWNALNGTLTPAVQTGVNSLENLSGIVNEGFDSYKKNAGFDFLYNKGTRDIAGGAAAKGLLNSGASAKALAQFESNLGNTMYNNWLDRLSQVSQLGMSAANPLVGAGGWSTSNSSSQSTGTGSTNDSGKGIIGTLFSDPLLKENVVPVGALHNGLTVYAYNYIGDDTPRIGLMADEVEKLHPDAVVEVLTDGGVFKAVNYGKAVQ